MQLHKDQFSQIVFDTETRTIEFKWLAHPPMDYLLECFKLSVSLIAKYKAKYVLADNSIGVQMDMGTQRSVIENAGAMKDMVIEKYARIVPLDIFQEMVSYKIADHTLGIFTDSAKFKVFSNKAVAMAWLYSTVEAPFEKDDVLLHKSAE